MPGVGVGVAVGLMGSAASAPVELPTDNLIARWHQGAGIVEGDDGGETTVATWTDVVSSVVLGNTPAANQPRLPASTPTFEGDGVAVVHCIETGVTGLGEHVSHTVVVSGVVNYAAGSRFLFEGTAGNRTFRIRTDDGLLGFTAPGPGNVSSAVVADGSRRSLILTLDAVSGDAVLYDDNTAIASSAAYDGTSTVTSFLAVGSNNASAVARGFNGTMNEVLLYSAVLDAAARAQVVAFLNQEYG